MALVPCIGVTPGAGAFDAAEFVEWDGAGHLPSAYGQSETMNELFGSFGAPIGAGIGLIFGVIVLLIKSFFKPITILAALPLSLAGAIFGLMVAGSEGDGRRHGPHRARARRRLRVPRADGDRGDRRADQLHGAVAGAAPVVYELIDDFEMWIKPKLARLVVLPPEGEVKAGHEVRTPT